MGKVNKKRAAELAERTANIPEIPEHFQEWINSVLYCNDNFVFYKRKGSYADFRCSACRADYRMRIKAGETLESRFEKVIEPPKHNMPCRCEACGAQGVYKASGKIKDGSVYGIRRRCYVGQKYREGVVVRYFEIEKYIRKTREQSYIITEVARNFFFPGKKVQKDYQLLDYTGKAAWHDHNIGGLWNISQKEGRVYPESYEAMKGTAFAYTGLREYEKRRGTVKMGKYLEAYERCPYLEGFEKKGLYGLTDYLAEGGETKTIIKDSGARHPADVIGIWPEKLRMLAGEAGSVGMLEILQLEREEGERWPEDIIRQIHDLKLNPIQLKETVLKHMTIRKFLNRAGKYAGVRYERNLCGMAVNRLQRMAWKYLDYLQMRREKGYDLNNTVFAYPADLDAAHDRMVEEINEERNRKRKKEAEERYSGIREKYEELYRRYYYAAEGLCIRPVCSAEEMLEEGRSLHHCVGTETYLEKHARGKSTILLLRRTGDPDVPYITVEMRKTEILQWHGEFNRQPDQEKNEKWLKNYVRYLEQADKEGEEIVIRIRAAG